MLTYYLNECTQAPGFGHISTKHSDVVVGGGGVMGLWWCDDVVIVVVGVNVVDVVVEAVVLMFVSTLATLGPSFRISCGIEPPWGAPCGPHCSATTLVATNPHVWFPIEVYLCACKSISIPIQSGSNKQC